MSAVKINCNCKEVPINPIVKSRTHYYSSRQALIRDGLIYDTISLTNYPVNC
jgi:hypothetical protein